MNIIYSNYDLEHQSEIESIYIQCIGIDDQQHICTPDSSMCKCGIKVKRKKLLRDDWKLYSCYECTY